LSEFDSIYAPSRIGDTGNEDIVDLQGNPDADDSDFLEEGQFNDQFDADSQVPYESVYANYAGEVNEALDTDYIPIGLKDVIRTYFSSLEP
jgi:hypothetical protein